MHGETLKYEDPALY